MANELYQTQLITKFLTVRSTATFYWAVTNLLLDHPYQVAAEINRNLGLDTLWLFEWLNMISDQGTIVSMKTRRVGGQQGPAHEFIGHDKPHGNVAGFAPTSFITATINWHPSVDLTGKYQTRVSPIAIGSFRPHGWFPIFALAADAFCFVHITAHLTVSGIPFVAVCRDKNGSAVGINSGSLYFPPTRQKNRRWVP